MKQQFKAGDKVIFDKGFVNTFIAETTNVNEQVTQYQKLVLAGINQAGSVKEYGPSMTTVSYEDGWDLPIPTKYLVLLPQSSS